MTDILPYRNGRLLPCYHVKDELTEGHILAYADDERIPVRGDWVVVGVRTEEAALLRRYEPAALVPDDVRILGVCPMICIPIQ